MVWIITTHSLPICRLVSLLSSHNTYRSLYMQLQGQEQISFILDDQHEMTKPCEVLQELVWLGGGLRLAQMKKLVVHQYAGNVVSYLNGESIGYTYC